jgi:hypothetical protein
MLVKCSKNTTKILSQESEGKWEQSTMFEENQLVNRMKNVLMLKSKSGAQRVALTQTMATYWSLPINMTTQVGKKLVCYKPNNPII